MKKTLVFTILLFTAFAANAQLSWDVRVGANVSQFSKGSAGLKLGIQAGVTAEYGFTPLFALRPGLRFSMKGSSDSWSFASGFPSRYNLSYLELPVLASFRFRLSDKHVIAVNAGPYIGYRINKERKALPGSNAFEAGLEAGIDFIFGRFVFGPSAQYGLTKVATTGEGALHNLCYSLTFGYKF